MTKLILFALGSLLILGFYACKSDPFKNDISNITHKLEIYNLDSVLIASDWNEILRINSALQIELGDAYGYVLGTCLNISSPSDTVVANSLKRFKSDPYISKLEKEIKKKFYPVREMNGALDSAFRRLKFHLPQAALPKRIVWANTLFNSSVFATETDLVVGMERYLGGKHPLVQQLPTDVFFEWIKEGMDVKYLHRDIITTWLMTHVVEETDGNLAEQMVRYGKILVLVEAAFPDLLKETILRYKKEDLEWANDHIFAFWDYLKNENLLFKNDERDKMNFLNPGPFTVGLPEKGPDRLGQFLGWRMVHSFLEKNEVSLATLMETPYTKILQEFEID
ncbi:MAG: hypothetical protein KJ941_06860 [Bacteroidetes bacterium]|nr:hypothetical protein [Bacteroidota bacterium]